MLRPSSLSTSIHTYHLVIVRNASMVMDYSLLHHELVLHEPAMRHPYDFMRPMTTWGSVQYSFATWHHSTLATGELLMGILGLSMVISGFE